MSEVTAGILTEQASRLSVLEERFSRLERASARNAVRLRAVEEGARTDRKTLETLRAAVETLTGAKQRKKGYEITPTLRWWATGGQDALTDEERAAGVLRLRDWVERVYKPVYGSLGKLGDCWPEHKLCVITLDWLCELWHVLYETPERDARTLTQMADFGTRIVPAAAALLARQTSGGCHMTEAGR